MRFLLLALLLVAACKHSTSSSSTSHSETQTTTDSTSSESGATTTVTTQTEGPGKTTTTVEEFSPPKEGDASDATDERSGMLQPDGGLPATPGAVSRPSHGPLVRRTVTVTERGAETTETHQQASTQAQGATETRETEKVDAKAQEATSSKPALSCAFGGWLVTVVIGVAILGIIYGALKLRKMI